MIKQVSIIELMQKITLSADQFKLNTSRGWQDMLVEKLSHKQVPAIIRAIETYGFTDPICITDCGDKGWELGNGHHRLCIAIMLGMDTVPVDFSSWYSESSSENSSRIYKGYQEDDADLAGWISDNVAESFFDRLYNIF